METDFQGEVVQHKDLKLGIRVKQVFIIKDLKITRDCIIYSDVILWVRMPPWMDKLQKEL